MAIDVLWDDVEVTTDNHGHIFLFPGDHLVNQPIHPGQLVGEIDASRRIAVRKIYIDDADVADGSFKKSRVTVCFIASEDFVNCFDWETRHNRHPV